jgi:hypothetical protein
MINIDTTLIHKENLFNQLEDSLIEKESFSDQYERVRKKRIWEQEESTVNILKKFINNEIDLSDKEIWDSLRSGICRYSEQNDLEPIQFVKTLIIEYYKNIVSAKSLILSLGKDPSRQNLSEELQEQTWKENGITLKKLTQSGKKSLHIYNGEWVKGKDLVENDKGLATKAMDFKVVSSLYNIVTYNKYNKWIGGSTKDVFNDVNKTIEDFNSIKNNDTKLLIILDGKYWDDGCRNSLMRYNNKMLMITCTDDCGCQEVIDFIGIKKD